MDAIVCSAYENAHNFSELCITGTLNEILCINSGSAVMDTADALVNAANNQLQNGAGIAKAYVDCGGQIIQQECNAIVAKNGPIPTSENAVTSAGCLNAPHLINAVGPIWDNNNPVRSTELLAYSMYNIIRTARLLCDSHVVVPLVSAGIFGFGATKSAEILTKAVVDFYFYWYQTPYGKYTEDVIAQAVNTTRFPKPPASCPPGLYPSKITIVGFYQTPTDYVALKKSINDRQADINAWRSMQHITGTGTFTGSEMSMTLPPISPPAVPVPPAMTPHPTPRPTPTPPSPSPPSPCGPISCWALAIIIVVIIVGLCIFGVICLRMNAKKRGYGVLK